MITVSSLLCVKNFEWSWINLYRLKIILVFLLFLLCSLFLFVVDSPSAHPEDIVANQQLCAELCAEHDLLSNNETTIFVSVDSEV
jgi:hypothetical protein